MAHLAASQPKLLARVRRLAGQVAAIERQLLEDADCSQLLQLVSSVRGAVGGLMDELIRDHVREHIAAPHLTDDARTEAAEELLVLIRRYGK